MRVLTISFLITLHPNYYIRYHHSESMMSLLTFPLSVSATEEFFHTDSLKFD